MNKALLGVFVALAGWGVSLPASAILIGFGPSGQVVGVGDAPSVDLVISGLGDGVAPSVGTFDLDVNFDAGVLNLSSVVFGTQLDVLGLGSLQFSTPGAGLVNLFELSFDLPVDLDTLQSSSFVLATLTFDALAVGASGLTITLNALGDAEGNALGADLGSGSITVSRAAVPVPEPAVLPLLALGVLGVMGWVGVMRRRIR